LSQRFSYDLVRTDHRRGFHLHAAGTLRWYPAARRSLFCYRQLFAVLLRFGQRRIGLAAVAALGRAFSWTRACGC
jgi:hypothetical protein